MKINEITNEVALGFYLHHRQDHGRIQTESTFLALLRDASKFTNRDSFSGQLLSHDPLLSDSWLGNLGYLVLLDQIGSVVSIKNNKDKTTKPSVIKALKQFSKLNHQEINALYCLRNSFAHDYSLINKGRKPEYYYRFSLRANKNDPMIILPNRMWNGDMRKDEKDTITVINLWALGNFVEELVLNIISEFEKNNLEINLNGGKDELLSKFIMIMTK